MISYGSPVTKAVNIEDCIEGLGTVLDPDNEEMVAFMEAQVQEENKRLQEENKRLQEENARLRSRLSDAEKDEAMAHCAAMQAFAVTNYFTEKCKELGIEVGESELLA